MDSTDCLGLPFPECDPPLTKDKSDVEQFRDLALAVDSAVTSLDGAVTEYVTAPDACRMTGGLTGPGRIIDIPFTSTDFDNSGMAQPTLAGIQIQRDGWYMIGSSIQALGGATVDPGGLGMRAQPTVNGDPVSNRQGPGRPTVTGASTTDDVAINPVTLFLSTGDVIGVRTNHNQSAALSVTYAASLWALRILTNV